MRRPFRNPKANGLDRLRLEAIAKLDEATRANLLAEQALRDGRPTDCDEVARFRELARTARQAAEAYALALG